MYVGTYFTVLVFVLQTICGSTYEEASLQYCVDIVFMVQTSCTLAPISLEFASWFVSEAATRLIDKHGSTRMALVKYSKEVSEVLPLLSTEDFLDRLNTSELYSEYDCQENMAQTYDALDFIKNGNYFNQAFEINSVNGPVERGKIVVVLNDGVAFQRKGNMEQAFTKTAASIQALHSEIGVSYMTLEFTEYRGEDREGSEEMSLYQPNLAKMRMDEQPIQKFNDSLLKYTCSHADEVITTTTTTKKPTTTTTSTTTTTTTTTPNPTTTKASTPEVCVDVVFGIDISCSLEVSNITKAFEISQNIIDSFGPTSQFGGLNYDETVVDTFPFTSDVESAKESVRNFRTTAVACGTKTKRAIEKMRSDYFDSPADNPNQKDLIILFGDGNEVPWKTNRDILDTADAFKHANGTIIWVVLTSNRGEFKIQRGLEEEIKISASKDDNGEPLVYDHLDPDVVDKIKEYALRKFACNSV